MSQHPILRPATRLSAVAGLVATLVVLLASPAGAHAELIQSDPTPGAVLTQAPSEIKLNFTESVDAQGGAVRVYDRDGERVDRGGIEASGSTVRMPLPDLGDGAYVVTWRVTSADSHPVSGAFTFQVGATGSGATSQEVTGLASRLLSEQGGDQVVGATYGVVRFVVFAGLALLIGGAWFAFAIWPPARRSRAARRLAWSGWGATFVATLAGLGVYGPYAEGLGLGDAFSTSLLGDTLGVRFGQVWLARAVLLLLAVPLLLRLFARDGDEPESRPLPVWWMVAGAVVGVALAATPGVAGHAVSGDWVTAAVVADTLHVLAMALWLGGLVVLAVVGLARNAPVRARDALEPFSKMALGCVLVLVATGAFQTWRQVGSLDALRTTDYGRILVVKLVLVALVVVFAAFSREVVLRLVPPRRGEEPLPAVAGGADDDVDDEEEYQLDEEYELRQLRRSVWAEIATAALILVATALLVNAAPAKTVGASGGSGVEGVTLQDDQVRVDVTVTPAVAGTNDVHVDVANPDGAPKDVDELTVSFAEPDKDIAAIDVPLRRLAPGHYYSPGFEIPLPGDWKVTARPLLSEFEQPTLRGTIEIG